MIVTCLKCGKQFSHEPAVVSSVRCECGSIIEVPPIQDTGTKPSSRSAERSRYRAFLAAGIVTNNSTMALALSLFGVAIPLLGLAGIGMALHTLLTKRGPLARWSGRPYALGAIAIGVLATMAHGYLVSHWLADRRDMRLAMLQEEARLDLVALSYAQQAFFSSRNRFGDAQEIRFKPPYGVYTIHLSATAVVPQTAGELDDAPLPPGLSVGFGPTGFTAVAVGNLDDDDDLDIWSITSHNKLVHLVDDLGDARPATNAGDGAGAPVHASADARTDGNSDRSTDGSTEGGTDGNSDGSTDGNSDGSTDSPARQR